MQDQECTLNIRHDASQEVWDKVAVLYSTLEGWMGFGDGTQGEKGIPYWFSFDEDEKHVLASVEPSGLQFSGWMDTDEWNHWKQEVKQKATDLLGYKVGEIEEGEVEI